MGWPNVAVFEPVLILRPENVRIGAQSRIDSFVKIEGGRGVELGAYTHVSSFCHLGIGGGRLIVGDHVGFASGSKVLTGSNMPEGQSMSAASPPSMQVVEKATTVIGSYVLIGANAVVMPGVSIGEGSVLAAGAVATRDIPPWEIWAGVPAKRIRARTMADGVVPESV